MADTIIQFVLPNLLFLIFVFLVFSILQSVIVLFLIWLEHENHDRLMVLMLKCYKYYRKIQLVFQAAVVLLMAGALWIVWTFISNFSERPEFVVFAAVLFFLITLVYFVLTHLKGRMSLKKGKDGILYFVLSLILYIFILALVEQRFPDYRHFVAMNVVKPAVEGVEKTIEEGREERLLNEFRQMARNGQCSAIDYRRQKKTDTIFNFVYITTDPEFKVKEGEPVPGELRYIVVGRKCSNGKETYHLTDYGKWYWVVDTEKQAVLTP